MKSILFLFCLFMFASCGKSTEQKIADAIDQAQTFLTDGNCDKAIKVLEEVGSQGSDPIYLEVYASAFACYAKFETIKFIANDLDNIDSNSFQDLIKSLSILSYSKETTVESIAYQGMNKAIGVLLQDSAANQPSQNKREQKFGPRKAGDLGMEILVYSLVQLGKFLNLYGNVNASGIKGQGAGTNHCFINYTYNSAQNVRTLSGGSCNSNSSGHAGLSIISPVTATGNRRRCEGLMLFTNILDVLNHLDVSGNETFKDLAAISTQANTIVTVAETSFPQIQTLLETTSQKKCEELLQTGSESDNMELIYALLFETGLQ